MSTQQPHAPHPTNPILICGAGPVGLSAALALTAQGVPCRIIDAGAGPSQHSKALGTHPRTLEVLAPYGVSDALVAGGFALDRVRIGAEGKLTSELAFDPAAMEDCAFTATRLIPQSDVERVLIAALAERGLEVEWNTRLVDLKQDASGVRAELQDADGAELAVATDWLIGCDGAHSATRKLAGIGFEGTADPERWGLVDVNLAADDTPNVATLFFHRDGPCIRFPLLDGHCRVMTTLPEDFPEELDPERFEALVEERTGQGWRFERVLWSSAFRISYRLASRYRQGRVFLCGDAAHIHSPVGGQGMNTGIQDAINLAWKLVEVIQERAGDGLLDTYEAERRPIARELLDRTERATRVVVTRSSAVEWLRRTAIKRLSGWGFVRHAFTRATTMMTVAYDDTPAADEDVESVWFADLFRDPDSEEPTLSDRRAFKKGPRPGHRMPDPAIGPDGWRVSQLLDGRRHLAILFDGERHTDSGRERLKTLHDQTVAMGMTALVVSGDPRVQSSVWASHVCTDDDGVLVETFGGQSECLYIVRPDSVIGYRAQPPEPAALSRWFDHTYRFNLGE